MAICNITGLEEFKKIIQNKRIVNNNELHIKTIDISNILYLILIDTPTDVVNIIHDYYKKEYTIKYNIHHNYEYYTRRQQLKIYFNYNNKIIPCVYTFQSNKSIFTSYMYEYYICGFLKKYNIIGCSKYRHKYITRCGILKTEEIRDVITILNYLLKCINDILDSQLKK